MQIDNAREPIRLTTQYRMDPAIQQFPSRHFYGSRLVAAEDVLAREPVMLLPSIPGPYVVVDVPEGKERTPADSTSFTNDAELAAVVALVKTLRALRTPPQAIGIITFYSAMKAALLEALSVDAGHGLVVNTVDGFQVNGRAPRRPYPHNPTTHTPAPFPFTGTPLLLLAEAAFSAG